MSISLMRRVFLHYFFLSPSMLCLHHATRADKRIITTLYFAVSQPDLHMIRSVTANKIAQFFGTSLGPRAKGTGNGKVKKTCPFVTHR